MKEGIHPNYVPAGVHCACGNTFVTRSTHGDIETDVCGKCHPFYTGTQKLIDTAGRVDRFRRRYEKGVAQRAAATAAAAASHASAAQKPAAEKPAVTAERLAALVEKAAPVAEKPAPVAEKPAPVAEKPPEG